MELRQKNNSCELAFIDEDISEIEEQEKIKGFLDYLDNQEIYDYAVLAFDGALAPEIRDKLGISIKERDYLQQRFKYWLNKYFNLPDRADKNRKRHRSDRKRINKNKAKYPNRHGLQPLTIKIPHQKRRSAEWMLEQQKNNTEPIHIIRPSPLFETDLSLWGR